MVIFDVFVVSNVHTRCFRISDGKVEAEQVTLDENLKCFGNNTNKVAEDELRNKISGASQ